MSELVGMYWDRSPYCVYRMHSPDGALIYIGATSHFNDRMSTHRRHSEWWPLIDVELTVVDGFATREGARDMEALLIRTRRPPFNLVEGRYPVADPVRASSQRDRPEYRQAIAALREQADLLDARPALIRQARAGGIRWDAIAEAARVSRVTAINLSKIE